MLLADGMAVPILHLHSPVELLIAKRALTIGGDSTLCEASDLMLSDQVSALLVSSDPLAILTERDLVRAFAGGCTAETPVSAMARSQPITVAGGADILDAASLMLQYGVHHLVVQMTEGAFGILSMREVTAVLLQAVKPDVWMTSVSLNVAIPGSETFRP